MRKAKELTKVILLDLLAILCFVGVVLFGWLPGPGGIPLFLGGLALLAINHEWAERYLEKFKDKAVSFKKVLFPNTPYIKRTYDTVSLFITGLAILVFFTVEQPIIKALSVALLCLGVVIFLTNRDRLDKISKKLKNKT